MRRTPDFHEQEYEMGRQRSDALVERDDDDAVDGDTNVVVHHRNRAPTREEDEEDVAEEDIMDVIDADDEAMVEG